MIRGYTLQEVVEAGHAPSVRWLQERLRRGEIHGYRVGRKGRGGAHHEWRMTDRDVEEFVEARRNHPAADRPSLALTDNRRFVTKAAS